MHLKAVIYTFLLISIFNFRFSSAAVSSVTFSKVLEDSETLVSSNANFKLGFFTPSDSTNRYLGIWYNNKNSSDNNLEIIWVANRDSPIKDLSAAVLKLSGDGNLQVTDEQNTVYWSSNVSSRNTNDSVVQLLDTGNLILHPRGSDTAIWQSFEHPTDSFLPGAKLMFNKSMYDAKTNIHSWKSNTDPSVGCFRVVSLPRDLPEFYIMEGKVPYWRSGPWNGYLFLGVPYVHAEVSFGFNIDDHTDSVEISYELTEQSLFERYLLTSDGVMARKHWDDSNSSWRVEWQSLGSECDVYSKCGAFAVCDPRKDPICECLKGFNPKNVDEWSKGNWTNGCVRRTELECRASGSKADKFLQLKHVKVPDYAQWIFANADACQRNCSRNCSCLAYSYYSGIGCMLWTVSLIDLQQYPADGADLFIRLAVSELPGKRDRRKIIIIIAVILGAFVSIFVYYTRKWMGHRYESKAATPPKDTQWQNIFGTPSCSNDYQDLPVFEFQRLADATNGFSETNKLGRGGFGQVYKGKWEDGQEIAVKRLSRDSGQGLQEFMNEVMVISKLQHKNLVRLLGCCVEGEEKLLVYELMPNKSLDFILFDPQNRQFQDWQTRFSIIQGISRGLLYLHRDSRLRIIHRDLKPSNILLDEDLNPKISDFGTAKIFGTKQDQASTLRIVGTYGYMSPEYAMEGRFSEKSDVYSFGVLLLEIVSGRRINKLPDYDSLNLLAYAWKLWNDNDVGSLIDPTIRNPCSEAQTFKCVQVGLLCIQESPADRPDVSTLISMLDFDDVETLPAPKQPGFTQTKSPRNCQEHCSVNGCSMTTLCCR